MTFVSAPQAPPVQGEFSGTLTHTIGAYCLVQYALHDASPVVFASGVVLGIPHGAVDHLVPAWFRTGATAVGRIPVLPGYAATAAVAFLLFLWAPTAALVLFLAASVVHFGRGEARGMPARP
ncbi:Brp/Blh family beta-carotene 15,15'-dioxygenase [Streptomyces sp. MMBL 11-3]|uniref:Brp/Blh family beta-carotene 15,15'-dioxygenase n=1 Tax=Streptomyces sp. MMBL 11-3 TaxID=3382639 RepID=UPI0039B5DE5F